MLALAWLVFCMGQALADNLVERGAYLTRAAGCMGCHTDKVGRGAPFAGGRALKTPFGIFYSPNITAHKQTGIGAWSDGDFLAAVKQGIRPDGAHYFPVFPYTSYTLLRAEDVLAIKAYMFSLTPVARQNRAHDVGPPFSWRWSMGAWKQLYFDAGEFIADDKQDAQWNRGAYLVNALAHCGECHTPRNAAGALDRTLWMAGTKDGPEGDAVPNITPAHNTGLGWPLDQLSFFLKTGTKPDWEKAEGLMAEAVQDGYKHLTDADRDAIAVYLNSLPAIENHVGD
jgi:mono/diheme cytochrome c family protein